MADDEVSKSAERAPVTPAAPLPLSTAPEQAHDAAAPPPEAPHDDPAVAARAALQAGRAGFVRRLLAFVLDVLAVWGLAALASIWTGAYSTPIALADVLTVVAFAALLLYFLWPFSRGGRTLGKALLGIKVISVDGSPLTWRQGAMRCFGYVATWLSFGLGFLWSAWDRDRRAWHDRLAGTCVVRSRLAREEIVGAVAPDVAARERARWRRGLGIPALAVLVALGVAVVLYFQHAAGELGPWPGLEVAPAAVVPRDVPQLGLSLALVEDARATGLWMDGRYADGVMASYAAGADTIAYVWALRYHEGRAAFSDFDDSEEWLPRKAGEVMNPLVYTHSNLRVLGIGVRSAQCTVVAEKTYLHDRWLVSIWARPTQGVTPEELATRIRDAIAERWRAGAGG